jgi:hypothetical protein
MPDAHQQFENRLHQHARRHFSRFPGVFHVPWDALYALGKGDPAAAEDVLLEMFGTDGMVAPRAISPSAVRALGGGSLEKGRRVLQRFVANLRAQETAEPQGTGRLYAKGGAVGKVSKQSVNYRQAEDNAFCARCKMFVEPASCTAVEGRIHRVDLCDLFEKA